MSAARLVTDDHLRVMCWVAPRVGESVERLVPGVAVGVEQDGELIAGAVYTRITWANADFHMAGTAGKPWATRKFFRAVVDLAFKTLDLPRVTAFMRADNIPVLRLAKHMGFTYEGTLRQACQDGADLLVYGLLKTECRWAER